jgi:ribonuclease P protein component
MWYYRGNVVHVPAKEKKEKNHPWIFGAPSHSYGPARPFPPESKGPEETCRLATILDFWHPIMAVKTISLPSDQFRAKGYKAISTPFFLLKIKKNFGENARIGIVIGKSVHKTAVKRNFWKRQVLAGLSPRAESGSDILIIVLPSINRLTKKQFKEELSKTLTKAQLQ